MTAPMSQLLPIPRVDISTIGDWPDHSYDVEFVRHEGRGGTEVVGSFKCAAEAEIFAEHYYRDLYIGGAE